MPQELVASNPATDGGGRVETIEGELLDPADGRKEPLQGQGIFIREPKSINPEAPKPAGFFASRKLAAKTQDVEDVKPAPKRGLFARTKPVEAPPVEPVLGGAEPASTPEKKSFFGRGKPKAASSSEASIAADVAVDPAPAKKSKLSFGSRKPAAEKVKPEPKAKKVKQARSAKAAKAPKDLTEVQLFTELESGKGLGWRVTPSGLEELKDLGDLSDAISFSKEDRRFAVEGVLGYKAALDLVLTELGNEAQIVNQSKALNSVYATAQARANGSPFLLRPGLQAVDLLKGDGPFVDANGNAVDVIFGFHLTDANADRSLAILYHLDMRGEISAPQISVNPDDMEFMLSQFAALKRVSLDEAQTVWFDNAKLLSVAGALQAYPNESVWQGIPLRRILWGVALAGCAVSALSGMWASTMLVQQSLKSRSLASLESSVKRIESKSSSLITGHLPQFAQVMSLPAEASLNRAAEFWTPGTQITMVGEARGVQYVMLKPLLTSERFNNRPSVAKRLEGADLLQFVDIPEPEGCKRESPALVGGMNEVQVTVGCQASDSSLSRYRLE